MTVPESNPTPADTITAEVREVDSATEPKQPPLDIRPMQPRKGQDMQVVVTGLDPYFTINVVVDFDGVLVGRVLTTGADGDAAFSTLAVKVGVATVTVRDMLGQQRLTADVIVTE